MISSASLMLRGWRLVALIGYYSRISRLYDGANGVLRYHSVGGGYHDNVSPDRLRRDIEYLDRNYEIVDLPAVLDSRGSNRVALTFDDGYRDFYEHVVPILHEYDVPATVFVIADAVDDPSFTHNDRFDYEYMGRQELGALVDDDLVTIGNHTRSHPDLSAVPTERLQDEIVGAKRWLEELLGVDIDRFCYPYCKFDARALELVRESHAFGVAGRGRREAIGAETDPAAIPRAIGANPPWEMRWDLSRPATVVGGFLDQIVGSDALGPRPEPDVGDDAPVADGGERFADGGERVAED